MSRTPTYELNARQKYRELMRRKDCFALYETAKGAYNYLVSVTKEGILLKTRAEGKEHFIRAENVRRALSFLFSEKTVVRKQLEAYTNFTSALLGLLKTIMGDLARFWVTKTGLYRLTVKGVRFAFSGVDRCNYNDLQALIDGRAEFILLSYFYLRKVSEVKWQELKALMLENSIRLFVDCGAYSVHNQKLAGKPIEEIDIYAYGQFVADNLDVIFGYFSLDVIGDEVQTRRNYQLLYSLTNVRPIPVWFPNLDDWRNSNWTWLEQLVAEEHNVIALGGTVFLGKKAGVRKQEQVKDELFSEVFSRFPCQNFHWLGGSSLLALKHPFFSADASTWRHGRTAKRQLVVLDENGSTCRAPEHWSKQECLRHNIRVLRNLEYLPFGEVQLSVFEDYGAE